MTIVGTASAVAEEFLGCKIFMKKQCKDICEDRTFSSLLCSA
jgi:hypothetical protein